MIEKIANLNGLSTNLMFSMFENNNKKIYLIENLKILSLGRNCIKNLTGLVNKVSI